MQTRSEYEAKWAENFRKWELNVGGKPLSELVRKWRDGDERASTAIDEFANLNDENYRIFRDVESLLGQGSFFPGNHKDFPKLPKTLACRTCPAFFGVEAPSPTNMTIRCEWPNGVQRVRVRLDETLEGGASVIDGQCRFEFGVSRDGFKPVPLEAVVGKTTVKDGNGDPKQADVTWEDLGEKERQLVKLVMAGKYGEAKEYTGGGQNKDYDGNKTYVFLRAVAQQHDRTLESVFSNDNVRIALQS